MTNNKNKNQVLALMGITAWRLREPSSVAPHCFSYQLNNAVGEPLGLLLADVVDEQIVSRQEQENLAQNIVKALTPHFITLATPEIDVPYAFAIVLGHHAKKIIEQGEKIVDRIIFYDGFAQIIQQAERKKELWSEIKPLRDLFAP
jgi:hypothetical protein